MVKNHMKRIRSPRTWNILRKTSKFVSRPNPGRSFDMAISLNTILKEFIGKTKTTKESKFLIKNKEVLVNSVARNDEKFPVGFLDVVSFPKEKEHYRLLINNKNKLVVNKIDQKEANLKLSKVSNITQLSKDKTQINCTDGRNILVKPSDKNLKETSINDSLLIDMEKNQIVEVIKLQKGSQVFLYKGRHVGSLVKVEHIEGNHIFFKEEDQEFETRKLYALSVGKDNKITIKA
jgi:small subunit ribosomal protein S4e